MVDKTTIKDKMQKSRDLSISRFYSASKKMTKLVASSMLLMLIVDFVFIAASIFYGTDLVGLCIAAGLTLIELLSYIIVASKKFNVKNGVSITLIAIAHLLPIGSFTYYGLILGLSASYLQAVLRLITVALFIGVAVYNIGEKEKLNTQTNRIEQYYYVKFGKKLLAFFALAVFLVATFATVAVNAGSLAIFNFSRRVSYVYDKETQELSVNRVYDGVAEIEILSEAYVLNFNGYKKYPVTSVKANAFEYVTRQDTITIPSGIKKIEAGAFSGSAISTIVIEGSEINFAESLKDSSIQNVIFNDDLCKTDLNKDTIYGVKYIGVNRDKINDYRVEYASIESIIAPKIEENEAYINYNNTTLETQIVTKDENGSFVVEDPFKGELAYEKEENGRKYKLVWWNMENNNSQTRIDFPYTSTTNLNLYAEWMPIYNVNYVYNDGVSTDVMPQEVYFSGGSVLIPDAIREGYTFMGWYESEGFTTAKVNEISDTIENDVTLYAKFLKNYDISYDFGYVTDDDADYVKLYHVEIANIKLPIPSRRGYDFNGWYTDSELTSKVSEIVCANGGNVQLYAGWTPIKYTITYENADLIQDMNQNATEFTIESEDIVLADLSLNGYTFLGWFTSADFNENSLVEGNAIPQGSIDNRTFYAKWSLNSPILSGFNGYTGVYDGNDHPLSLEAFHTAPDERGITYTYQWYFNGEKLDLESATNQYLVKNVIESGSYYCLVVASDGVYTSEPTQGDEIIATISKADYDMSDVKFEDLTVVYDGEVHAPVISGELPVGFDQIQLRVEYTSGATSVSESQKTVMAVFSTSSTNYNTPSTMSAKIIITPASFTNVNATPYVDVYNAQPHNSGTLYAESVNTQPIEYSFSLEQNGDYTTTNPQFVNAGQYVVYYKISAPNHEDYKGSYTAVINKRQLVVAINNVSAVYGEDTKSLSTYVTEGSYATDEQVFILSTQANSLSAVGKYDITYTQTNDNYDLTVNNISNSYTITPAAISMSYEAYKGVYDGKNHNAIQFTTSSVNNQPITILYSLTGVDGTYSTEIPAIQNAGEYNVYYKISAQNHVELSGVISDITIEKLKVSVSWNEPSLVYTGGDLSGKIIASFKTANGGSELLNLKHDEFINAGTYKFVAEFVNDDGNYQLEGFEKFYSISKADYDMSLITLNDKSYVYDGSSHSVRIDRELPIGADGIQLQVSYQGEATNVSDGQVRVIATFTTSSKNYNTPNPISAFVSIEKKNIDGASLQLGQSLVYNGKDQKQSITSITIDGLAVTYNVTGDTAKDAGEYTLIVTGKGNFEGQISQKWTIAKADYDMSGITFEDKTYVYDSNSHSITVSKELPTGADGVKLQVSYSGSATNVSDGRVKVTATFSTSSSNYNTPYPMEAYVSITAKDISNATVVLGDALIYNGSEQTQEISNVTVDGLNVTYYVEDNKQTNAGSYTLTIKGTGNFTGSYEQGWFIVAQRLNVNITANGGVYGNVKPSTYTVSGVQGNDNVTVTLKYSSASYEESEVPPVNVGTYTVKAYINDGNYQLVSQSKSFVIDKKTVEIIWCDNEYTYNGLEQSITAWYLDVDNQKVFLNVTTDKAFKNAGSYTATASFKGNDGVSYKLPTNVTNTYTIEKLDVSIIPTVSQNYMIYGNTVPMVSWTYANNSNQFVSSDNIGNFEFSHNITSKSSVGYYDISIVEKALNNYEVSYGTYENFEIKAREITVVAKDHEMVYGDTLPTLTWSYASGSLAFLDSDRVTLQVVTSATSTSNVDKYQITFVEKQVQNYQINYVNGELNIKAREISISIDNKSSVYGSEIMSLTSSITKGKLVNNDNLPYTLTTTATKNSSVGKYPITLNTTNNNYAVTVSKQGNYEITNATIQYTVNAYTGIYDGQKHQLVEITAIGVNGTEATVEYTVSGMSFSSPPMIADVGSYEILYTISAPNHNTVSGKCTSVITPYEAEIQWSEDNYVYNGTEQEIKSWFVDESGKTVYLTVTVDGTFKNVGTYTASAQAISGNYKLTGDTEKQYNVIPKAVIVSGIVAKDKEYDGTLDAELDYTSVIIDGLISGDTVSISAIGTFDNSDAGENKTVNIHDITIDNENYVIDLENSQDTSTASILAVELEPEDPEADPEEEPKDPESDPDSDPNLDTEPQE